MDEVVIFDDGQFQPKDLQYHKLTQNGNHQSEQSTYTGYTDPNHFLAHILSYLECPPYLRRSLFPRHPNLQYAGTLPSLDMPHHLKKTEWCQYREGVTKKTGEGDNMKAINAAPRPQTLLHTGLGQDVSIEGKLAENMRVTVRFEEEDQPIGTSGPLQATPVIPSAPREEMGLYWGYNVRIAKSLSTVLTECPFDGGYDLTFGTSERGQPISELEDQAFNREPLPRFKHMMIAFGGLAGLEVAVEADDQLKDIGVTRPGEVFDFWVNICPGQGSRTIRTEEAIWLGLMGLKGIATKQGRS